MLEVAAIATKSRERAGTFGVSRNDLYVWDEDCQPLYRQAFASAAAIRFETARLGGADMLHVIAFYPGGSGSGYFHQLLAFSPGGDELMPLAPAMLVHGNMGGFHAGKLDSERGDGIAIWDAEWTDGSHYSPHPATMTIYRWVDGGFVGPERLETKEKVPAKPDAAPKALGFAFVDNTREDLFYSIDALIAAPSGP